MSLPYLQVNPVNISMVGKEEEYMVIATSIIDETNFIRCS